MTAGTRAGPASDDRIGRGVRRTPGPVPAVVVIILGALTAATCLGLFATSPYRAEADPVPWLVQLVAAGLTVAAGLVAWYARPGNRVGPLLVATGFALVIDFLTFSANAFLYAIGDMWKLLAFAILANVFLAFPDGRTAGGSRRLAVAVYAWFFVMTGTIQAVREYPADWGLQNPLGLAPDAGLADALVAVSNIGALVLTSLVVATVAERWRRGSPARRRALAPVFWVSPITLVVLGAYFLGNALDNGALIAVSTGPLAQLSNLLLPLAFLAGLLQDRLGRGAIADLVGRQEEIPPTELEAVLARALHDPTLRLAFPVAGGTGWVDADGHPVPEPAEDDGRDVTRVEAGSATIAVLVHDPAVDDTLVREALGSARLALENTRLAAGLRAQLAEVQASRARIVEASDDERRRIERDLHDGAQQRFVALGFTLREASRLAATDRALGDLLAAATGELEDGLRELRALARGIHPTALADGLAAAVRELAGRSPLPVVVDVDPRRLPERVESAAYFIVAEALTNALRHAGASRVEVHARVRDGVLEVAVIDDGQGGADPGAGSGLRRLDDRAQAAGGTLAVQSGHATGTTVIARLPVTSP